MVYGFGLKIGLECEKDFKTSFVSINQEQFMTNLSLQEIMIHLLNKQYHGISKPKLETFIDDIILEGI